MEKITHRGRWFLPENTENKVLGTLTFSNENGIDLELDGSFTEDHRGEFLRPDIILGDTYSGKRVTLYLCNQHKHQNTNSGDVISTFSAIYLLEGDHFLTEDQLLFHRSISGYFNLGLWLRSQGFSYELAENTRSIQYKKPPSIPFTLDGVEGTFDFDIGGSSPSDSVFEIEEIKQRTVVCLEYETAQSFSKILKDVRHFQNFLTLAIYEPTYPNHIRLQHNERTQQVGSKEFPLTINLYFSPPYFKPVKDKHQYIFRYRDIQDDFPAIIRKWYALNEIIDYPLYLLFGSFYNATNPIENQFLDIARAVEILHRRLKSTGRNEPTLHQRLNSILGEVQNPFLDKVVYENFAEDVKNTRNYHTHLNPRLEEKAIKDAEELFMLTKRLKLVLVAVILQEMGLSQDQVSQLLEQNERRLFYYLISNE